MPPQTLKQAASTPSARNRSAEELLEAIFADLARTNMADTGELLRGLGAAIQILSTRIPAASARPREVWNHDQRETYRSRKTWESWILCQKLPHLGDWK